MTSSAVEALVSAYGIEALQHKLVFLGGNNSSREKRKGCNIPGLSERQRLALDLAGCGLQKKRQHRWLSVEAGHINRLRHDLLLGM